MPIPEPTMEESQEDFIERCMGNETMAEEFPDADQRRAVCQQKWDEARSEDAPSSERIWRAITTDVEFESRSTRKGTENRISGYASVFYDGTPGTQFQLTQNLMERIDEHAFDRVLDSSDDVLGLFNHNPDLVLGRRSAGTMKLSKDDRGLRFDIVLPNTNAGQDALESIRRRDVTGSSFSFAPKRQTHETVGDMNVRIIQDVELYDVGPVTFPAYKATSADINQRDIGAAIRHFERIRTHNEVEAEKAVKLAHEAYLKRVAEIEDQMGIDPAQRIA